MLRLAPQCLGSLVVVVVTAAIAGCAQPKPPAAAPRPAPSGPADVKLPADLSPNVLRDRRAQPGVRAPAKALVVGGAGSVKCGRLAKGTDGAEMDLLDGRLRLHPPANAKVPPLPPEAPSGAEESRIVAEPPAEKERAKLSMAIVARETFQLDPDLYEPEPDAPTKPEKLDVEAAKFLKATFPSEEPLEIVPVEIGTTAKMRAYAARPPHPNAPPGKDTALVLALLVAQDDGALESVAFYVRGENVRNATGSDLVGCTRLAERVASSIVPGPRKLERAAGTRVIADVSNDEALAVTVPADYVAIPSVAGHAGARITKLRPLSLYAGSISVVVGAGDAAAPEGVESTAAGKLLGRPIEWRGKTTPKGGFLFAAEPIERGAATAKGKTAEVLVKATRQAKALDEMRGVAETLSLVKRAAP